MVIKGIHHVSMTCSAEQYDRVIDFYTRILGLSIVRSFESGCLMDTGAGYVEIFHKHDALPKGTIKHFALEVDSAREYADLCKENGYTVFVEPKDVTLDGLDATVTFVLGPMGEEIEFFEVKNNG